MTHRLWRCSAALAVFCLLPLTAACQARPGAAAFVGDTRIGDSRVQDLFDEGLNDPAVRKAVNDLSGYRVVVLSRLIKHELITAMAAGLGVTATERDVADMLARQQQRLGGPQQLAATVAESLGLPQKQITTFMRDLALLDNVGKELTKDVTFSEAELRAFYDQNNGASVGPFEQIRQQVIDVMRQQRSGQAIERNVKDVLRTHPVRVNPRYGSFDASKFLDPQQSPVLKPRADDFFRSESADTPPQPVESPAS